jgi:hypothetical protein
MEKDLVLLFVIVVLIAMQIFERREHTKERRDLTNKVMSRDYSEYAVYEAQREAYRKAHHRMVSMEQEDRDLGIPVT